MYTAYFQRQVAITRGLMKHPPGHECEECEKTRRFLWKQGFR